MRFTFSHRHEQERRMIAFAPPPSPGEGQAPEPQTPPEGQRPKLDAVLGKLGESIDNIEARQVVEELKQQAIVDQNKAQEKLVATLDKASQLEFAFLTKALPDGRGLTPDAALTEIKNDFAARFPSFVDFKLEGGKLVVVPVSAETKERPEPTTQEERISQGIEDAMNVLGDKNASIGKKIAAIFKVFALGKEFLKRAMDGTLGDPYETEKSKGNRERLEIRNSIRAALNDGKTLDKVKEDKTKELNDKNQEITAKKQDLAAKEASLPGLEQQLTVITGTDQPSIDKRTALTQQITNLKTNIQTLKQDIAKAEADKALIERYIKEIDTMSNELAKVPDQIKNTLEKLGNALTNMPDDASKELGKALKGATVLETGALKYKVTGSNGKALNTSIKDVLRDKLDKDVTDGEMGMDAAGNVIDNAKFAEFVGGIEKSILDKSKELQAAVRTDITNKMKGSAVTENEQKAVTKAIENLTSAVWVKVEGADQEVIFTQGVLYKQGTKAGEGLQKLDLSGDKAAWVAVPNKYIGGADNSERDIPESGNDVKRGRLYEYKDHEWKPRSVSDFLEGGKVALKMTDGTDIDAEKIREALTKKDWVDLDDTLEMMYDGGQNLIIQVKDAPTSIQVFDVDGFGTTGNVTMKEESDQYFNGKTIVKLEGDLGDVSKRDRGYKYENHEWTPKSAKESIDTIKFNDADVETATNAALAAPNTWQESNNIHAYFNGEKLYTQNADGTDTRVFNLAEYKADDDGSGAFRDSLDGKYINGSGAEVTLPSDKTHIWDPEAHEWKFDLDTAISNLVPASDDQKEGAKAIAEGEGWIDNPKYNLEEGICVGNIIYMQLKDEPTEIWIADLDKGTYVNKKERYYDGAKNAVVSVPGARFRTSYDQTTRSWGKIEGSEHKNRRENRINEGKTVLDSLGAGYEGVSNGSKKNPKYVINKLVAGAAPTPVFDIRFSPSSHQWEWSSPLAPGVWSGMENIIPGAGADIDYANSVRARLQEINESQDTEAPEEA